MAKDEIIDAIHDTIEAIDSDQSQLWTTQSTSKSGLSWSDLTDLYMLRNVALESVWGLLDECPVERLKAGDVVIVAGEARQTMYLVVLGKLSVHLDKPENEPVAFLSRGQTVGELSVIDNRTASAFVLAAEDSVLLSINEDTFWRMVQASHGFATNLLLLMAERMRTTNTTVSKNIKLRDQFERDSKVDRLTSLNNRRWLDETMPRLITRHRGDNQPLTVMMLDVDHFKKFNDTYGHAAGDLVLAQVGRTIMEVLRPLDIGARYGGEEFVVIFPNTEMQGAFVAAERLRKSIMSKTLTTEEGTELPPVTISCGIALVDNEDTSESVIQRADGALYCAKKNGRNRVELG